MQMALTLFVALVMLAGGGAHLVRPDLFTVLVPGFLPAAAVITATGVLQIGIALAVLWPRTRAWGGLAFSVLCLGYLPLHLWDFVRPDPLFAPPLAASVRVVVQLLLVAAGWRLWRVRTRPMQAPTGR